MPDETYPNTAWRINGATTTGDTFIYYKYTQNAAITSGNVLLITGRSFAAVWPAYAFYDSNNKLLQSEQSESVSKGRSIQNAIVTVPDSAAYLIVNGESSNPPVVYNISESDLYKILSSSVKPYGKEIVNSSGFSSVLELQNNYIYLINSNAVSTISGLPAGLTGTSVLVKIRASVSHNTDTDYAIFYIMSRANSWFGVCYNGEITWTSLSQYTDFLSGLLTGLVYVEPIDSTYKAGAMHRNGDINTDDAVFIRYEFDVSALQGKEVFISGYHYALGYPLFVVMSNETVIDYLQGADVPNSSKKYEYYRYKIPENATKIVVNANNSAGQSRRYGSLQHVDSDGDLCASLRKESKRYLFIGDSYAEGYNPDGNVTGWCTNCVNYLGLTEDEYVILYKGGARFSAYNQTNTFLNLIKTIAYPFDYFTDIVICGGFNDSMQTEENILSGISAFVAYCKVLFPFARVHIGEVGYNKQPSGSVYPDWEQRRSNIENIVIPTYQRCVEFGAAYLNNVEYWVNEDSLSNSDGIHPTESGNKIIGRAVANAVLSGGAPLPYSADLRLH